MLWCLSVYVSTAILVDRLLCSTLVCLEMLDFFARHDLDHIVGLPLLEDKPQPLVRIVFLICLVLVVLDLDKVRVDSVWIKRK